MAVRGRCERRCGRAAGERAARAGSGDRQRGRGLAGGVETARGGMDFCAGPERACAWGKCGVVAGRAWCHTSTQRAAFSFHSRACLVSRLPDAGEGPAPRFKAHPAHASTHARSERGSERASRGKPAPRPQNAEHRQARARRGRGPRRRGRGGHHRGSGSSPCRPCARPGARGARGPSPARSPLPRRAWERRSGARRARAPSARSCFAGQPAALIAPTAPRASRADRAVPARGRDHQDPGARPPPRPLSPRPARGLGALRWAMGPGRRPRVAPARRRRTTGSSPTSTATSSSSSPRRSPRRRRTCRRCWQGARRPPPPVQPLAQPGPRRRPPPAAAAAAAGRPRCRWRWRARRARARWQTRSSSSPTRRACSPPAPAPRPAPASTCSSAQPTAWWGAPLPSCQARR
jgi:hypothetical protein